MPINNTVVRPYRTRILPRWRLQAVFLRKTQRGFDFAHRFDQPRRHVVFQVTLAEPKRGHRAVQCEALVMLPDRDGNAVNFATPVTSTMTKAAFAQIPRVGIEARPVALEGGRVLPMSG